MEEDRYWNDHPNPHGCMSCKHSQQICWGHSECVNPNGYRYEERVSLASDACDFWEEDT